MSSYYSTQNLSYKGTSLQVKSKLLNDSNNSKDQSLLHFLDSS